MPEIPIGYSAHDRKTTWNPRVRVVNMLAEKTDTNLLNGYDHIQRPGEVEFLNLGADPVQGVFRQAGTFDGDFLVGQSADLYRVSEAGSSTLLGALGGTDRFVAAATATRVIVVANGVATSTNGTTVTNVAMPDGRLVGSVAQLNGYFILPELDSARFYWTEPGQVDPDGLSFATTESTPGSILKVERVGDELWFFKEEGLEVWTPTGDADLPFQRQPGRNYDKGARSRDAICRFDNTVAWVGNDGIVYRGDATPVRMSNHSVEEQIRKSFADDLTAWYFPMDGHSLWCLTLTDGTWAYDAATQQWPTFKTYSQETWRCHVGDQGDGFVLAGSSTDGRLYRLDPEASNDAGLVLERIVTGGLPVLKDPVRCNSLSVYATAGTTADPNAYPKMRIRWSDDMQTWDDFEDVSVGRQGRYGDPITLTRLGDMRYPGRLFEFTVTDDCVVTISGAAVNEQVR